MVLKKTFYKIFDFYLVMMITQSMLTLLLAASVHGMPAIADKTKPLSSVNIVHQHLLVPPGIDLLNTYPHKFIRQPLPAWKSSSSKPVNIYPYEFIRRFRSGRSHEGQSSTRGFVNFYPKELPSRDTGASKRSYPYWHVRRLMLNAADSDVVHRLTVLERRMIEDAFTARNQRRLRLLRFSSSNDEFTSEKSYCHVHPDICTGGR